MAALFTLMRTTDPETTVRDSSWIVVNAVVDSDANCIGVFNLEYCCVCHGYDCQTWYAFTIPAPGMICGVTLFCYRNLINARIHCLTLSLARFTAHPCVRHAMHTLVTVDDSHLPELLRLGMLDVAKQFVQGQDRQLQLHGMSTLTQLLAVGTPCHVLSCVVLCGSVDKHNPCGVYRVHCWQHELPMFSSPPHTHAYRQCSRCVEQRCAVP